MMHTIHYQWNFKPNEKNAINKNVIQSNLMYINTYTIVTPTILHTLLSRVETTMFPDLLQLYNRIPHWVIKSDIGRLLYIFFNGGLYSDCDCFIQKQLDKHREEHKIILFTEKICNSVNELGQRESKHPDNVLRVANYCFGSTSVKHPFLKEVIDECIHRLKYIIYNQNKHNLSHTDILWVCGPDVITTIYHKSKHKYDDIFLYDTSYLEHKQFGSWR